MEEDLEGLPVFSNLTGKQVPLSSVATVTPQWSAGVIRHHESRRTVSVLAGNKGRLADSILKDAWPKIQALTLPPGYSVEIAGEKKEMDKAFGELLVVFGVIIASLLGLLVLQLGSLRKTLVVLLAVPLALIGAALGLYLGGYSFSFMAFLGVVALAGMVIKNSVVWVEFVDRAEAKGKGRRESVIEAGIYRLRPIMLTTVTTVGGLIPLGLFGGVLFEPMAWAMIGGLSVSTVLILLVVPVVFTLLVPDPKKQKNHRSAKVEGDAEGWGSERDQAEERGAEGEDGKSAERGAEEGGGKREEREAREEPLEGPHRDAPSPSQNSETREKE